IKSIDVMQNPVVAGQPATGMVTLNFFTPLPDDRFTLTIIDTSIVSVSGVPLFGTSNASEPFAQGIIPFFPSGNGSPANFVARFTANSPPHTATYGTGSEYVDINGNGVFDPVNKDDDQTNKDLIFHFGLISDAIFAGQFTPAGSNPSVPQFDRLGAYGQVN